MNNKPRSKEMIGWFRLERLVMLGLLIVGPASVKLTMAQWTNIGPPGGSVYSIAIHPQDTSIIFAGTPVGIYTSTNGGQNWNPLNNGLTCSALDNLGVSTLIIDPQTPATMYAGTGCGVYKTTNGGGSWSPMNNGITYPGSAYPIETLAIASQTPSTIYAGTDGGVYKSTDGGGSWNTMNNGLTNPYTVIPSVYTLVVDSKTPATIYAGTSRGGVYKSTDGGGVWAPMNNGLTNLRISSMAIDPQAPATIFVGTFDGGIYSSNDGGRSWIPMNTGPANSTITALAIDPQTPNTIYAGTYYDGLYKSIDGGRSWDSMNNGLTDLSVGVLAIDPHTPAKVYAGTYNAGMYKSSDSGGSWNLMNDGLMHYSHVHALAFDPVRPATLYAGTWFGIYQSSDGGESWRLMNNGLKNPNVEALAIDPQMPGTVYAGTFEGIVYKSIDEGEHWRPMSDGLPNLGDNYYMPLVIDPQMPSAIYAGTGGVYKSLNGGESWNPMNNGLTYSGSNTLGVIALAIDPQTPDTIYAGTNGVGVYRSTDGAETWSPSNTSLGPVRAFAINPQNPATVYAGGEFSGVYRSDDSGGSWNPVNQGLAEYEVNALTIDPETPAALYVGTSSIPAHGVSNRNIYRSMDGGGSWSIFKTQLSYSSISVLAVDPQNSSRIYVGTEGEGIFVYSGTDCSYFVSPGNGNYSSSGIANDQLEVTTSAGCGWRAGSHEPWITVTSGTSGWGNGTVRFSVSPNTYPGSRAGALTIASQTFTVSQDGRNSPLLIGSISPNWGPAAGGTLVALNGGGFEVGASVAVGGSPAQVTALTSDSISAVTGTALEAGTYDVVVTNPGGQSVVLTKGFTYLPVSGPQTTPLFVPIVLSAGGMNGSFFTSEMTLTNRGTAEATINFSYSSAFGSGSGTGSDTLPAGQQRIVPDAISYLRSLGIPIPSSGSQGGTLLVTISGLASPSDCAVTVRTTTVVLEGRAGLAYAGVSPSTALTDASYICGLRQSEKDRSNVALQNAGSAADGSITLRLTVFSGVGGTEVFKVLPDLVLAPAAFVQISGILASNGLGLANGFVRVERVSGTAPYYAYGVINDQANSDGSFILPVLESAMAGKTRMTLSALVEVGAFSTELVVTNFSSTKKTLNCRYVADAVQTPDHTARFSIDINSSQQLSLPDYVQQLREAGISGIGVRGPTYAGALFVSVSTGDLSGITVGARTSAEGGKGRYGVFYTAVPEGESPTNEAWLFGLQQNDQNRSNLALINTGESDAQPDTFRIELFDGIKGLKVNTVEGIILNAHQWYQVGTILSRYAPGIVQGYARITRTAGTNPFIAYAVINDGRAPGERSGDGAFVLSAP